MKKLLIPVILFCAAPLCAQVAVSTPVVTSSITIAAIGDLLIHENVKKSAAAAAEGVKDNPEAFGYAALLEDLKPELSSADITFANLETPIAPKANKGVRSCVFNTPPSFLDAVKATGIDLVSVANNHIYDQGRDGALETIENLEKAGLPYIGAGKTRAAALTPRVLEKNGIRVAFMAFTQLFEQPLNTDNPNEFYANFADTQTIIPSIRKGRNMADFVAVSMHWGTEYEEEPAPETRQLAHALCDAGADIIIGHHPHVLQPLELYHAADGRYCGIIYSLGNFISNQSRFYVYNISPDKMGDTRDGAVLFFNVERRDYGRGVVRTELAKLRFAPIWTYNDTMDAAGKAPRIRALSLDRAIEQAKAAVAALPDAPKPDQQADYIAKVRALETLVNRRAQILERVGEDYVIPPDTVIKNAPKTIVFSPVK